MIDRLKRILDAFTKTVKSRSSWHAISKVDESEKGCALFVVVVAGMLLLVIMGESIWASSPNLRIGVLAITALFIVALLADVLKALMPMLVAIAALVYIAKNC
jgi:hypothetical protein